MAYSTLQLISWHIWNDSRVSITCSGGQTVHFQPLYIFSWITKPNFPARKSNFVARGFPVSSLFPCTIFGWGREFLQDHSDLWKAIRFHLVEEIPTCSTLLAYLPQKVIQRIELFIASEDCILALWSPWQCVRKILFSIFSVRMKPYMVHTQVWEPSSLVA